MLTAAASFEVQHGIHDMLQRPRPGERSLLGHVTDDDHRRPARLGKYEIEREKQQSEQAEQRKSMVRSGDRSEKIRTYNFPQNRVTDHRVPHLTLHKLDQLMSGSLDALIDPVTAHFQAEQLKGEQDAA